MPNPEGKNGYGDKTRPNEDDLKEALFQYAREGLKLQERLVSLHDEFNFAIGLTLLKKLNKEFGVPTVRKPESMETMRQAITDEVEMDLRQGNGPNFVKSKLKDKGMAVPRRVVREVMHEQFPTGFDIRFPGKRKTQTPRVPLFSLGPFYEVSADGHEKISQQALKMGDIGLPIYAYKDKWSDTLVKICLVPNVRKPGPIGHLFLDFAKEIGGVPVQLTTDQGTEIGWQFALQGVTRIVFAPEIDPDLDPYYVILKSIHNTIIEGFWRWLREKLGLNLREIIWQGKTERIFNPMVPFHSDLFYWIFVPIVQEALDEFRIWWNQHRVRTQPNKNMPSGHVPIHALRHPQMYAGLDCLIRVPSEAIDELRKILIEEVGSREDNLGWYSKEFGQIADRSYGEIGSPSISLQNAWKIFQTMSDAIGAAS